MTVTALDGILFAIMLISALLAMIRGFSREVLSIVSWIVAAVAAYMFYEPLTPYAREYIASDTVAMLAAAGAAFLVTLVVVSFITLHIADFIVDSRIGALDRTLGFIFGAVRGLLLVVVAMLFFNWLAPQNQPTWIATARSKPMLDDLGAKLVAALPSDPEGVIDRFREPESAPAPSDGAVPPADTGGAPSEGGALPGEESQSIDGLIGGSGRQPAN